ncbi:hypothetical protein [Microviridae sp.]|nr:hypothetical protein [Microviridae sp.]
MGRSSSRKKVKNRALRLRRRSGGLRPEPRKSESLPYGLRPLTHTYRETGNANLGTV